MKFRNFAKIKNGIFVSTLIQFFFLNNPCVLFEIGILSGSGPGVFRPLLLTLYPYRVCGTI
jgi:hypothetical protein